MTGQVGEVGEVIGGLPAAPTAQALTFANPGGHRIFHAAARTGGGAIVIAGGFALDMGAAGGPAAPAAIELTLAAGVATGAEVDGPAGGYPAALTLAGGDVLVTGGDPAVDTAGCGDAVSTTGGVACALAGAWRYPSAGGAGAMTGAMQVARYGHRLTRLADGTVLVNGGLTPAVTAPFDGAIRAVADAELFEPRGTPTIPRPASASTASRATWPATAPAAPGGRVRGARAHRSVTPRGAR